jgi:hypothetical protein
MSMVLGTRYSGYKKSSVERMSRSRYQSININTRGACSASLTYAVGHEGMLPNVHTQIQTYQDEVLIAPRLDSIHHI